MGKGKEMQLFYFHKVTDFFLPELLSSNDKINKLYKIRLIIAIKLNQPPTFNHSVNVENITRNLESFATFANKESIWFLI